jgi:hypothetical protein
VSAPTAPAPQQLLASAPTEGCPLCGAPLAGDLVWCLHCGAAARTRLAAAPRWKGPIVALAIVAALALGVLAAALVKLAGDSGPGPAPVTRTVTTAAAPSLTTTPTTPVPPVATTPAAPGSSSGAATAPSKGATTPGATARSTPSAPTGGGAATNTKTAQGGLSSK